MESLRSEGSWCGETHIQKALFLCQEIALVPSRFKFILYKHGPFSFELSDHLQGLILDDLVRVRTRPPYGPTLEVSEEGRTLAAEALRNNSAAERIALMSKRLSAKNVAELEKLATAIYVNGKLGLDATVRQRAEYLTTLKPHVSLDAALKAFDEAKEIKEAFPPRLRPATVPN
jgi:uncharacterized protein YwgA